MCDVYFDLTNDGVFKMLFPDESCEDRLRDFLNIILQYEGAEQITEVKILNPVKDGEFLEAKDSVLDLHVRDNRNRRYNVEMQVKAPEEYPKRALYYASKLYGSQLVRGKKYKALRKTVSITILKNNYFDCEELHNLYRFRNERDGSLLSDDLIEMHFFEVGKFNEIRQEKLSDYEAWLFIFHYGERILSGDIVLSDRLLSVPGIKEAVEIMRFANEDEATRLLLMSREKYRRDQEALQDARWQEGLEEGRQEEKLEIARKMKTDGFPVEVIQKMTGLTAEEIAKLDTKVEAQEPAD